LRERAGRVIGASRQRLTETLCLVAGAVLPFGRVLLLGEIVHIRFQRVTGVQEYIIRERHGGCVADAEINTCHVVARRLRLEFVLANDVKLPALFAIVPDGADLLDVL